MLMGMVDTIFADVAQPDQARIVALNASYFLKTGGQTLFEYTLLLSGLKTFLS